MARRISTLLTILIGLFLFVYLITRDSSDVTIRERIEVELPKMNQVKQDVARENIRTKLNIKLPKKEAKVKRPLKVKVIPTVRPPVVEVVDVPRSPSRPNKIPEDAGSNDAKDRVQKQVMKQQIKNDNEIRLLIQNVVGSPPSPPPPSDPLSVKPFPLARLKKAGLAVDKMEAPGSREKATDGAVARVKAIKPDTVDTSDDTLTEATAELLVIPVRGVKDKLDARPDLITPPKRVKQRLPKAEPVVVAPLAETPVAATTIKTLATPAILPLPVSTDIRSHPLVIQLSKRDFTSSTFSTNPVLEGKSTTSSSKSIRSNITLCALVTDENRFLPEWLLFHRLQGVDRFILYDSQAAGGAAELRSINSRTEGEGLKAVVKKEKEEDEEYGGLDGLDFEGRIYPERLDGIEEWIEQGVVVFNYMNIGIAGRKPDAIHDLMNQHCSTTYASTSDWIVSLDVDEFLITTSSELDPTGSTLHAAYAASKAEPARGSTYPIYDLLSTLDSACVPIPITTFRNIGIRELGREDTVLEAHLKRNQIDANLGQKMIIRPNFTPGVVDLIGADSCQVHDKSKKIGDPRGNVLRKGGLYKGGASSVLTTPLVIAHFPQRSLWSCYATISLFTGSFEPSRATEYCEEDYVPSPDEKSDPMFRDEVGNEFLQLPPRDGTLVGDTHVRDSWAGKGTIEILKQWRLIEASRSMGAERVKSIISMVNVVKI